MEREAHRDGCRLPVVTLGTENTPHGRTPPPEKCDVKECANEPKPPRVTWLLSCETLEWLEDELSPNRP